MLVSCQGCADSTSAAAWAFVALALVLMAAAGFAIGHLRARLLLGRALREAQQQARHAAALRSGFSWRTDAQHRLLSWQGPDQAAQAHSTVFDDSTLARRLRAEQAFSGLRVQAPQGQDGSLGWELRGLPQHDEQGRFAGFVGSAHATDHHDSQLAASAVLPVLLAALDGPALVAQRGAHDAAADGSGWRVQQHNAAGLALWPQLSMGATLHGQLAALQATLPPAVAAALLQSETPTLEEAGWKLCPLPQPAGQRGLLLLKTTAAEPGAAAPGGGAAASEATESESFSFTVSHDLRAPIRVVEGFTRIVKEDYGRLLDRVGNDHLDRVLGAAARMNLMIDALLTLARLSSQPLARQPVNLSQLASYVVDDLRRAAPEREAEVDIEAGLTTQGDPTLLRLVLENLLGNAWKYSARCGKAQISLQQVPHGTHGKAYVVRDNGAGFDMRSADRLFGLFQRLHSASEFPGHGVGLASVRRIVRRHGGDIWAEAEPGRGAAFYFTLRD